MDDYKLSVSGVKFWHRFDDLVCFMLSARDAAALCVAASGINHMDKPAKKNSVGLTFKSDTQPVPGHSGKPQSNG